jgi:hypothetical protein
MHVSMLETVQKKKVAAGWQLMYDIEFQKR